MFWPVAPLGSCTRLVILLQMPHTTTVYVLHKAVSVLVQLEMCNVIVKHEEIHRGPAKVKCVRMMFVYRV